MFAFMKFHDLDTITDVSNEGLQILVTHVYKNNWQKLLKRMFASPSRKPDKKEKKKKIEPQFQSYLR